MKSIKLGLEGKVCIVTGAGRGLGLEVAKRLASVGGKVVIVSRTRSELEKAAHEIRDNKGEVLSIPADISNPTQVHDTVDKVLHQYGTIDILINNAGGESGTAILGSDEEKWDRTMDVNLKGAVNCMNAVLPGMIAQKYGKICSTSSHAGIIGPPAMPYKSGYGVAKWGLQALTRQVALQVGPHGINVNAIIPGWVITNLTLKDIPSPLTFYNVKEIPKDNSITQMAETMAARMPSRRINTVQDIANLVTFLVSDVSRQIMGQAIFIDGGMHMA